MDTFDAPKRNDGESDGDYNARVNKARDEYEAGLRSGNYMNQNGQGDNTVNGVKQGSTTTEQQASGIEASQKEITEAGKSASDGGAKEAGGGAPGGTNLSSANAPQGGALGAEQQDTNKTLGVHDLVTGAQKGGMTTGAEKSINSLVPERRPDESDADFQARVETTRKASADTLVPQSPSNAPSPSFANDTERHANASEEQKRAWADQRDPAGARLRAAGIDPTDPAAMAMATTEQQKMSASDRIDAGSTKDDDKDRHTLLEELKDDVVALQAKIDKVGVSAPLMRARTLLDDALVSVRQHVVV